MPSASPAAKRPDPMPRFERSGVAEGPIVQGFTAEGFSVDGHVYGAVLLTPQKAAAWDAPGFETLTIEALEPLLALDPSPEFVILGTGPTHRIAPRALTAALEE